MWLEDYTSNPWFCVCHKYSKFGAEKFLGDERRRYVFQKYSTQLSKRGYKVVEKRRKNRVSKKSTSPRETTTWFNNLTPEELKVLWGHEIDCLNQQGKIIAGPLGSIPLSPAQTEQKGKPKAPAKAK